MDHQITQQFINHVMDALTAFTKATAPAAVTKISEGAANKVGEELVEQGKYLISVIRNRFAKEQQSNQDNTTQLALDGFLADPDTFRSALANKLHTILLSDPEFFTMINQLVHQGTVQTINVDQSSVAVGNTLIDKTRNAHQSIQAKGKSKAKNNTLKAE